MNVENHWRFVDMKSQQCRGGTWKLYAFLILVHSRVQGTPLEKFQVLIPWNELDRDTWIVARESKKGNTSEGEAGWKENTVW